MKRTGILVICIFFLSFSVSSQEGPVSSGRNNHIEFMKSDTLPVEITPLPSRINTPFSEYNGILFPDSVFFFSSLRNENEEDFENLFDSYWAMKIYQSKLTTGGYSKPVTLPAVLNSKKYFNANFTFNRNRNKIYLTRCQPSTESDLQCGIWESKKSKGKWTKPVPLSRKINLPGTTTTQPFLVDHEEFSVLYFASDRPKGYGGMDIWYVIIKNGKPGEPINAGNKINSAGNEITPFYDKNSKRLYFSSDFHPGIGGYDIFYTEGALSEWSSPTNIGVPFNSERNDYYFTVNGFDRGGYFCSNRIIGKSHAADTCCYDIYEYFWTGFEKPVAVNPQDSLSVDTVPVTEKMKKLLPLTLYFDNDEPDPKSWDTTTKVNYMTALADYISLKDIYLNEYTKGLDGEEKREALRNMESFFKDSVERGFAGLELFARYLLQALEEGKNITLKVSGYASPLHKQEYNRILSSRRIQSFINYLKGYNNGILMRYINGQNGNRLVIHADPQGSTEGIRKNISDNIHDRRNSVYSISASSERRIRITEMITD